MKFQKKFLLVIIFIMPMLSAFCMEYDTTDIYDFNLKNSDLNYIYLYNLSMQDKWDSLETFLQKRPCLKHSSVCGENIVLSCFKNNAITSLSIIYKHMPEECERIVDDICSSIPQDSSFHSGDISEAFVDNFKNLSNSSKLKVNWEYFKKKVIDDAHMKEERKRLQCFHKYRAEFLNLYDQAKKEGYISFCKQEIPMDKLNISHPIDSPSAKRSIEERV